MLATRRVTTYSMYVPLVTIHYSDNILVEKEPDLLAADLHRPVVPDRFSTRVYLCLICFLSGAAVMIVEITGNRLLAPLFGSSMYTWTALIGVILVAISLGGYLGGWLVDRKPGAGMLSLVLILAGVSTLLVYPLNTLLHDTVADMGLIAGPVALSLSLFAIPGVLLGAVSPITVRLLSSVSQDRHIGFSAGTVGLFGTLGSFLGTFATGFVLLPAFGARTIFLTCGIGVALLAALALIAGGLSPGKRAFASATAAILVALGFFLVLQPAKDPNVLWQHSTFYHDVKVFEKADARGNQNRYLMLDSTMQGGQQAETGNLIFEYQGYWKLAEVLQADVRTAAFLGGGAFGMPQHLSTRYPEAKVVVVDIDPAVIDAGRRYFRLDHYPRVQPYAMDARSFLRTAGESYDLVFGDAYNSARYIPAHLTTREFFQQVKSRLAPDGVYMMNIISSVSGPRSELLKVMYRTLTTVFEDVEIFGVQTGNSQTAQNIILVAADHKLGSRLDGYRITDSQTRFLLRKRLPRRLHPSRNGPVLTDDHNPVEYLVAKQMSLSTPSLTVTEKDRTSVGLTKL